MNYADLPGETWAEIHYLAKHRQQHSDPQVARAAYEWASDVRGESAGTWLRVGLVATLEGLLGGSGVGAGSQFGEWWQARRVWRLGPPPAEAD